MTLPGIRILYMVTIGVLAHKHQSPVGAHHHATTGPANRWLPLRVNIRTMGYQDCNHRARP